MQIRTRKNTVALIRTTYDPVTKRGQTEQLGTLPKDSSSAPEVLMEQLTAPERRQLSNWLSVNQQLHQAEVQRNAALNLPQQLRDAAEWYRRQSKSTNLNALAAAARDEWSAVLAAMSVAGVGRTRKRIAGSTQKKTRQIGGS